MNLFIKMAIFTLIGFAALLIGGIFTGSGVPGAWYQSLAKAPWTPPGWVFGLAWTTVILFFSVYMGLAWDIIQNRKLLLILFVLQLILNIGWNPVFFYFHEVLAGLLFISALTLLILVFIFVFWHEMKVKTLLLLPYLIWLILATSLNAYILLKNQVP